MRVLAKKKHDRNCDVRSDKPTMTSFGPESESRRSFFKKKKKMSLAAMEINRAYRREVTVI